MDAGKTFQNSGRDGMVLFSLSGPPAGRSEWVIGIIFWQDKNCSMDEKSKVWPRLYDQFRHFSSWLVHKMLCSI